MSWAALVYATFMVSFAFGLKELLKRRDSRRNLQ